MHHADALFSKRIAEVFVFVPFGSTTSLEKAEASKAED